MRSLPRAPGSWRSRGACAAIATSGVLACADADVALWTASPGAARQPIIGGFAAEQAIFDATGALVAVDQDGLLAPFCTASAIGAEAVVTAKHCGRILPELERQGVRVEWRSGPSVVEPTHVARVVGVLTAPGDVGGYTGEGRDVAVALLDGPVAVEPVELAGLDASWLGRSLITLGYGVFSPSGEADGRRRIGRETLRAVEGRVHEALFGDFESFVEWSFTRQTTEADFLELEAGDPSIDEYRLEYETALLFDEHEAVGGGAPGDLLSCRGDSGGPLLSVDDAGRLVSHGVISGGPNSLRSECEFGSVYASFGPVTLRFLLDSRTWSDPCGDVDEAGRCQGDVVERCVTSLTANLRRVSRDDCAALSLTCLEQGGRARCAAAEDPGD